MIDRWPLRQVRSFLRKKSRTSGLPGVFVSLPYLLDPGLTGLANEDGGEGGERCGENLSVVLAIQRLCYL